MTAVRMWASCPRCAWLWEATVSEGTTAEVVCGCGTEFVVPQQHSGARTVISAGDKIRSRITAGDAAVAALAEIKELHKPIQVCRGCSSSECDGWCEWGDDYGGELLTVCAECCINGADRYRRLNDVCFDEHEHGSEHNQVAACPTMAIIARAGLC